jgi:hypothetical protein
LRYFVLFDEKGDIIIIIDSFKKCDYFWDSENKKIIIIDKFLIDFNLSKEENKKSINSDYVNITKEEKEKIEQLVNLLLLLWYNQNNSFLSNFNNSPS